MNALESNVGRGIVQPPRHKHHAPRPLCLVDPNALAVAARAIAAQVKAIKRAHGAGSYLFVGVGLHNSADSAVYAYVLSENKGIAPAWVSEKWRWLVGLYLPHSKPGLTAAAAELVEDLDYHLRDAGFIATATAGRECGGPSAGVGNPAHPVDGLPRRGGAAEVAFPSLHDTPGRSSREGLGHG